MKAFMLGAAAGAVLAVVGSAQAQRLNLPAPQSETPAISLSRTQPFPLPYTTNEATKEILYNRFPMFNEYRTDPKLVLGFDLTPNFGLEAGYTNLFSRGFHYADIEARHENREGALGQGGFTSYAAVKLTVPVNDRLTAYSKFGIAYSERDTFARSVKDADAGPYANVGAHYKLSDRATLSGEYQRTGDTKKWGNDTNANGVGAKLNLGF